MWSGQSRGESAGCEASLYSAITLPNPATAKRPAVGLTAAAELRQPSAASPGPPRAASGRAGAERRAGPPRG